MTDVSQRSSTDWQVQEAGETDWRQDVRIPAAESNVEVNFVESVFGRRGTVVAEVGDYESTLVIIDPPISGARPWGDVRIYLTNLSTQVDAAQADADAAQATADNALTIANGAAGSAGNALLRSGGTMTGDIVLAADANAPLEPATLQQMQAADALLMPLVGGTFSGAVVHGYTTALKVPVGTTPQRPTGAAGLVRYNSDAATFEGFTTSWGPLGGGSFYVSPTPPSTPTQGAPWWNSEDGCLYLYYDDGNSQAFVPATPFPSGGVVGAADLLSAEDNLLINGSMEIWQRGTAFTPASGAATVRSADRWVFDCGTGSTVVTSQQLINPGGQVGGDSLRYHHSLARNVTGSGSLIFYQRIEDVRTAEAQTVTLSFQVNSTVAGTFTAQFNQNFGTGGSPSAGAAGSPVNVTVNNANTWERKILVIAVPSITGKTLGTNADHFLNLVFTIPIGLGNASWYFTNLDLRLGSIAPTKFLRRPIGQELALCQRYYQIFQNVTASGYNGAGSTVLTEFPYPVQMRANPTPTYTGQTYNNASALTTSVANTTHIRMQVTITALGFGFGTCALALDAEL